MLPTISFFLVLILSTNVAARAARADTLSDDEPVHVYFGNGCFFHTQHSFVNQLEKLILKRSGSDITALAAYAGGLDDPSTEDLCYHNADSYADYGELGHAEVVSMTLDDSDSVKEAAKVFFLDFKELEPGQWTRQDVFDRGTEYRAVIGLPGGVTGPYYSAVSAANDEVHKLKLMEGSGGDEDTIDTGVVWVYDTARFPSRQAEVCLQFHDDAPTYSEPYSERYHELKDTLLEAGTITNTTCPVNYIC
mmetsp:Transcript_8500/g.17046  ORF Transcript_8500/g.17046 Transcript_8500/m.17046 type:complete len:249 (-) Transcript_8500:3-749(-)